MRLRNCLLLLVVELLVDFGVIGLARDLLLKPIEASVYLADELRKFLVENISKLIFCHIAHHYAPACGNRQDRHMPNTRRWQDMNIVDNNRKQGSQTMEQAPHNQRGEEPEQTPETVVSPEVRRIREGIAEALREGQTIDHETAWLIAREITPGSGPLHELAMTGEISPDIGSDLETAYEVLPEVADTWIAALDGYC
jgi:hypothetical protein